MVGVADETIQWPLRITNAPRQSEGQGIRPIALLPVYGEKVPAGG